MRSDNDISYWISAIKNDGLARKIIHCAPFSRIRGVSFLGAIDHSALFSGESSHSGSRADHSIGVAALSLFVSHYRGYDLDLTRHIVAASLLHDIGHLPLSHSVEPYFVEKFGYGHHEAGRKILFGDSAFSESLHSNLSKSLDLDFIDKLLSPDSGDFCGSDIFKSPFNVDTIEGITRASISRIASSDQINPIDVARASFLEGNEDKVAILDGFWNAKDRVYSEVINSDYGVMSDYISQAFFKQEGGDSLVESCVSESDINWIDLYPQLFSSLRKVGAKNCPSNQINFNPLERRERRFIIDSSKSSSERYKTA